LAGGIRSGGNSRKDEGVKVQHFNRRGYLNCMYTNIRSINNNFKIQELQSRLKEYDVDILGITESWTKSEIGDAELSIKGYEMFRKDRNMGGKSRGGGFYCTLGKV